MRGCDRLLYWSKTFYQDGCQFCRLLRAIFSSDCLPVLATRCHLFAAPLTYPITIQLARLQNLKPKVKRCQCLVSSEVYSTDLSDYLRSSSILSSVIPVVSSLSPISENSHKLGVVRRLESFPYSSSSSLSHGSTVGLGPSSSQR